MEIKKQCIPNKAEAMMFFTNLIYKVQDKPDFLKYLISLNFFGVIHDELYADIDYHVLTLHILWCVGMIFRALPQEQISFLSVFGTTAFERQQYSNNTQVQAAVEEFIKEFFDVDEEQDIRPESS